MGTSRLRISSQQKPKLWFVVASQPAAQIAKRDIAKPAISESK
jgi:hypothetical protein